ncbi:MAG: hypothetical protein LBT37_05965 [Lactobacillaceae bacterium]|jgi:hypothetical protein|nr:hypothetical protein [Lactobacillaceae bacterium]
MSIKKLVLVSILGLITITTLAYALIVALPNNQQVKTIQAKNTALKMKLPKTNSKIKVKASEQTTIQLAQPLINKFFTVYETYGTSTEYYARTKKLANVAVPAVLENKKLFGSDKDVSGNSYIDTSGLHVKTTAVDFYPSSSNDSTTSGLTVMEFTGEFKDKGASTGQMIWNVTYDRKLNKISNVTYVGTEYPMASSVAVAD